jgi:hypothetical protein
MGKAGGSAELAAFESSPSKAPMQAQNIDSSKVEEPVAEVPALLARPDWMKKVPEGS